MCTCSHASRRIKCTTRNIRWQHVPNSTALASHFVEVGFQFYRFNGFLLWKSWQQRLLFKSRFYAQNFSLHFEQYLLHFHPLTLRCVWEKQRLQCCSELSRWSHFHILISLTFRHLAGSDRCLLICLRCH